MELFDMLRELEEKNVCDEQTRKALSIKDSFIEEQVKLVYKYVLKNYNNNNVAIYALGRKLLFLEELATSSLDVQAKVKGWLQDSKRLFLFDHSPQGDMYGELLLAEAQGELEDFRKRKNPDVPLQKPFEYDQTLSIDHSADNMPSLEQALTNVHRKLSAVLVNAEKEYFDYFLRKNKPKNQGIKIYDTRELYQDNFRALKECLIAFVEQDYNGDISVEYGSKYDLKELCINAHISKEVRSELTSLREAYVDVARMVKRYDKLSSRMKKDRKLTYSLDLSDKSPLDVRYGNDSGCCVGIYEQLGYIGNAFGLPQFMLDNSVYIFNINLQLNDGKKKRVGIVLAFNMHNEKNEKILACNSLELSSAMNPIMYCSSIVDFAEQGLIDFCRKNDFKACIMSKHSYNTSYNYSRKKDTNPAKEETLVKKETRPKGNFYSDILYYTNELEVNEYNFYKIFDDRE